MMTDERRPIPGYEGLYEVDQHGNVYALFPDKGKPSGRQMKIIPVKSGYMRVALTKDSVNKHHLLHRLVMLAWNPVENSAELDVNHEDGDKANNSLSNLTWMTHAQNIRHAHRSLKRWETRRGESTGTAKLTVDAVREIRRMRSGGMKHKDIAAIYDVTPELISMVCLRKLWTHVE